MVPTSTQRRADVHTTSSQRYGRYKGVETRRGTTTAG